MLPENRDETPEVVSFRDMMIALERFDSREAAIIRGEICKVWIDLLDREKQALVRAESRRQALEVEGWTCLCCGGPPHL